MSSLAHFTGVLYSPAWVFTLSVYHHRFPKTSNSKRADVKHLRFLYVVTHSFNPFALVLVNNSPKYTKERNIKQRKRIRNKSLRHP